jgi:hypothetical protein
MFFSEQPGFVRLVPAEVMRMSVEVLADLAAE